MEIEKVKVKLVILANNHIDFPRIVEEYEIEVNKTVKVKELKEMINKNYGYAKNEITIFHSEKQYFSDIQKIELEVNDEIEAKISSKKVDYSEMKLYQLSPSSFYRVQEGSDEIVKVENNEKDEIYERDSLKIVNPNLFFFFLTKKKNLQKKKKFILGYF